MLFHMLKNTVKVAEELDVTEHVELIIADDLVVVTRRKHLHVVRGSRHCSDTRAREGDFRRRAEQNRQVNVACLSALVNNIEQLVGCVGDIVNAVGVIPHNAEILRCRLERCETSYGFIAVGDAVRV